MGWRQLKLVSDHSASLRVNIVQRLLSNHHVFPSWPKDPNLVIGSLTWWQARREKIPRMYHLRVYTFTTVGSTDSFNEPRLSFMFQWIDKSPFLTQIHFQWCWCKVEELSSPHSHPRLTTCQKHWTSLGFLLIDIQNIFLWKTKKR